MSTEHAAASQLVEAFGQATTEVTEALKSAKSAKVRQDLRVEALALERGWKGAGGSTSLARVSKALGRLRAALGLCGLLGLRGLGALPGLGGYPLVSLAEARDVAFAHRKQARAGGDPLTEKRHAQHVPTVEEAAAAVLEQQRSGWRHARYERDRPRSLRAYAFRRIGALPVSDVTTRCAGNPDPDLARQARDRVAGTVTDPRRDEVGGRDGLPAGQPSGRRPRAGPRTAAGRRPAHAGAAPRRGGRRPRDRASLPGLGHHQGCVRVPGADGGALRRNAPGNVGREGPGRGRCGPSPPRA